MFGWLRRWWHARQRAVDMDILWPTIVQTTEGDADTAKAVFAVHAFNDRAWTDEFTHDEIYTFIDRLEVNQSCQTK